MLKKSPKNEYFIKQINLRSEMSSFEAKIIKFYAIFHDFNFAGFIILFCIKSTFYICITSISAAIKLSYNFF